MAPQMLAIGGIKIAIGIKTNIIFDKKKYKQNESNINSINEKFYLLDKTIYHIFTILCNSIKKKILLCFVNKSLNTYEKRNKLSLQVMIDYCEKNDLSNGCSAT